MISNFAINWRPKMLYGGPSNKIKCLNIKTSSYNVLKIRHINTLLTAFLNVFVEKFM